MERRKWARFPVEFPVAFTGDDILGEGKAIDLSMGGVGVTVTSEQGVPPGSYLAVRLALPDRKPPLEVPVAAVRWSRRQLFGLQLLSLGDEDTDRLDRFLATLET